MKDSKKKLKSAFAVTFRIKCVLFQADEYMKQTK